MSTTATRTAGTVSRPPGDSELAGIADRLLIAITKDSKRWLVLLGCASVAGTGTAILLPTALGHTLDALLALRPGAARAASARAGSVTHWLSVCAVLAAVGTLTSAVASLAAGTSSATATARLRQRLVRHVIDRGPDVLRSFAPGDAVSRVIVGAADAGSAPISVLTTITSAIPPIGSVVALGLIDPWLVAAFAAGFPVLAVVLRALVRDSSAVTLGYQREQSAITARLLEALTGARTIAAAGTQAAERRRILAPLTGLRALGDASWRIQARGEARSMVIAPALQLLVLAVAGVELTRHQITPGGLVAAAQYASIAVGLGGASVGLGQLGHARGAARRAAGLLASPALQYGAARLAPGRGELRLAGITVRRGEQTVLRDLYLTVPGGAMVAVVGKSGSGKSTLASVAGRLTDPDEGSVTLDGTELRALTRQELRIAVGYAFERPSLFGATPLDAIAFGIWRPDDDQLLDAAAASCAGEFLLRLPHGPRTPLEEVPMSGGEAQRLGLARTFAHAQQARLLILDDATSSLDTVTEMLVSRALTSRLRGTTKLIVAHRLTTAARADLVAWLDGGTVRAVAPHAALWAHPGYRALFTGRPQPARAGWGRAGRDWAGRSRAG